MLLGFPKREIFLKDFRGFLRIDSSPEVHWDKSLQTSLNRIEDDIFFLGGFSGI